MWSAAPSRHAPASGGPGALRLGFALTPGLRVGLYGGSFNPAHAGHLHVAQTALTRLQLDRVVWLVTPQNPLKPAHGLAPLAKRMAGARRLARGPAMSVSDAEVRLGVVYTVDTVRRLKARFPGVKFVWIMGSDSLARFHDWRGWTQIMADLPVAIIARPGALSRSLAAPAARRFAAARLPARAAPRLADASPPAWVYLTAPLNAASSTALRSTADAALQTD